MATNGQNGLVVEESPLSAYLDSQQRLETPVAVFARAHDQGEIIEPVHAKLIPLTAPKADEQYAFEVNLDQCTGCKACVAACHSLNGLDEEETWRDVGMIIGGTPAEPYQQTITTACHHCEDPGCLNGCPVLAYEKDPITGIVSHLDDQCIGCEYCVLKCPYDVPKYSEKKGIVRKCDMCHERLEVGEAPACVQACPTEAIKITTVTRSSAAAPYRNPDFLAAFPDAAYTRPTTRYVSEKPIPENTEAADKFAYRVQSAHWPLVWMLTLTQAGWGVLAANRLTYTSPFIDVFGAILFFAGIFMSVSHLGRPLGAWRAFLGLKRSWLSREIVVFGGVMPLTILTVLSSWVELLKPFYGLLSWSNVGLGALGVYCSVMIYHDTQRTLWKFPKTAADFFTTSIIVGCVTIGLLYQNVGLLLVGAVTVLLKQLAALSLQLRPSETLSYALKAKQYLLRNDLKPSFRLRQGVSTFGLSVCLVVLLIEFPKGFGVIYAVVGICAMLASEVMGRAHFFQTVDSPKMPGGLTK